MKQELGPFWMIEVRSTLNPLLLDWLLTTLSSSLFFLFFCLCVATLFRFYRRGRYSIQGALTLLTSTLTWRLRSDLDSLSLSSLHPLYVSPPSRAPLFWCNSKCKDLLGRPAGVISLASLERVIKEDGTTGLDECREYIVGCMESVRRYLSNMYEKGIQDSRVMDTQQDSMDPPKPLQMVIIFSLQSSGMANLELELLPFLLDLLKNHFPGMVGAVYIVHYGWVHSGMWGLAKRVLPQQALSKIFFPSKKELPDHFDLGNLPESLGGTWDITLNDESNDVMKRFARPNLYGVLYSKGKGTAEEAEWESNSAPPSPRGISGTSSPLPGRSSRGISRSGSYDSLFDHFYSSQNTPFRTPRASQTPTPHNEPTQFFDGSSSPVAPMLRMTPTAEKKLQQLQVTQGAANRRRTNSDANRRMITDDFTFSRSSRSPNLSRGNSPTRSKRRMPRNVHFQAASTLESSTIKNTSSRRGSLRDFRIQDGDFEATAEWAADSSGSEQSDRSGKVGESTKVVGTKDENKQGGFFARWRGPFRHPASTLEEVAAQEKKGTDDAEVEDDLAELDPTPVPSPRLQVPDIEEPPLSGFQSLSEANHVLSRRSRKFGSLPGHVSPYNASNPFYGYPAYPVSVDDDMARRTTLHQQGQEQKRLQYRRRKRDLLRTLMYLFVLRLLSMHRGLRNQILASYRTIVRAAHVGGILEDEEEKEEWKEANERYNRLRSASIRYNQDHPQDFQLQQQRRRAKPQPLVELGFRKRYAFLLLFLFIVARRNWRIQLRQNLKEWLGFAGLGTVGMNSIQQDQTVIGRDATLEVDVPTPSVTGLHLRRRLGWH